MQEYQVLPSIGIGPVKLGMRRDEVRATMGVDSVCFRKTAADRYETDAYHQSGFQVFYEGDEPTVEYIELSTGCDFVASYKGVDVFHTRADDLLALIAQDASYDEANQELGYSFVFPQIELSVWRPAVPQSPDDLEGQYFSTIGIGIAGYYSNSKDSSFG